MALQPMPVFQSIANGAVPRDPTRGYKPINVDVSALRREASRAVKVDVRVAAELHYRGKQRDYEVAKFSGSLRLPFPSMWFEWTRKDPTAGHVQYGVHLGEADMPDGGYTIRANLFKRALVDGAYKLIFPNVHCEVVLDASGNFVEKRACQCHGGGQRTFVSDMDESVRHEFLDDLIIAYLAVSLMNCANVELVKADPVCSKPRPRGTKKRGEPFGIRYRTIVLPGMSHGGGQGDVQNRDIMALHRVRGHFKTYTAEAPLLGQHVGTYWWGWQVRGNKKNGVAVSDYKIGEHAHA